MTASMTDTETPTETEVPTPETEPDVTGVPSPEPPKHGTNSPDEENRPEEKPKDLEVILPEGGLVMVAGMECTVLPLKSRQFFALIRILTSGLGPELAAMDLTGLENDPDELQARLLSAFAFAVPNAIEETALFLNAIVEAKDPKDANAVMAEMMNPEIEVTLDTLGIMIEQEKDDLAGVLFPKVQAWVNRLQKTAKPKPR